MHDRQGDHEARPVEALGVSGQESQRFWAGHAFTISLTLRMCA